MDKYGKVLCNIGIARRFNMGYPAIFLVLFVATVNLYLGKLILGESRAKVSETKGKNIQIWGNILIYIVSLVGLAFLWL